QQTKSRTRQRARVCPKLEQLEDRLVPTVSVLGGFAGNFNRLTNSYASNNLAVGPNQIVQTTPADYTIFDKATGAQLANGTFSQLFGFDSNTSVALQTFQVRYDDDAQRFIFFGLDRNIFSDTPHVDRLDIAVSNDFNPLDGFSEIQRISVREVNP